MGVFGDNYVATVLVGRFVPVMRRGVAGVLADDPTLDVVFGDLGPRDLKMLPERDPLVVVIDECDEPVVSVQLRALRPDVGLVVLAERVEALYGRLLLAAGASCIPWRATAEEIREAVHLAAQNGCVFLADDGHRTEQAAYSRGGGLTRRELQVLKLVSSGCSPQEIASKLDISVETVRTHTSHVRIKLELPSKRILTGVSLPALLTEV